MVLVDKVIQEYHPYKGLGILAETALTFTNWWPGDNGSLVIILQWPCVSILLFRYWVNLGPVNTLRPRQNGRHFPDDIFKRIFLNENVWISLKISLKFVPKGPINNIPALVQIMAWRQTGAKPLSESMMVSLLTHICVTRPQWVKGLLLVKQQGLTWTMLDFSSLRHGVRDWYLHDLNANLVLAFYAYMQCFHSTHRFRSFSGWKLDHHYK